MNKRENKISHFMRDPNYLDLEKFYKKRPIALYTGAGVSWTSDDRYGMAGWDEFVRSILEADEGTDSSTIEDFNRRYDLCWVDKPWEMAEWVAKRIGREVFEEHVRNIVQRKQNYKEYKLIREDFLRVAPTLKAVTAFCGKFTGGRFVEYDSGRRAAIYENEPNPRVRAVITSNYDHYLEAASSSIFRNQILKPVGARGSSVGKLNQIPVFHIHGYVPFPKKPDKKVTEEPIPFVDPVVTKRDYEQAWRSDDVFNFTMGPQIHVLRHYSVLFIGFSFRDEWVSNLLEDLNEERKDRSDRMFHYALMKNDEVNAKGEDFFDKLGVKPIRLNNFGEIREVMSHLYQAALRVDYDDADIQLPFTISNREYKTCVPISLTPAQYYDQLYACRLSFVWEKQGKMAQTARS
ncbi:MAG: SIR2 family protein [Anaerolineales bacterium]|jgi:hypothetical protein